ncbi:MAG: tetratricopeptide repeat protein [Pseudomonadota bacterium]|nr:tetratricopeptide repeat protein [Pseudomonadota bacterium]MDP1902989.1 tetratricopeptide repeat protein [Pseudomonadota bacterium]MDP2352239.1 tetratricopeptide repeat protein [Pseudomonadota bacterium]
MAFDLEEQEQLDEFKAWWKQHGMKVILGVTVFLAAVGGWRAWQTWQHNQAAEASMLFDTAVQAASMNDVKSAKEVTARIMENQSSTAYATPAAWLAGRVNHDSGDLKSARAQYEYALEHADDDGLKQLARIRLAGIRFEDKDPVGALALLEGAFSPAFQSLAAQLKGDILAEQGKTADARAAYKLALEKLDDKSSLKPLLEIRLDGLGG